MVCILCEHFVFSAPPGWSPPSYDLSVSPRLVDWWRYGRDMVESGEWEEGSVVQWRGIRGRCCLNPSVVAKVGGDFCGHIKPPERFLSSEADDYFGGSYLKWRFDALKEKFERVVKQRDHARNLAKSRLERLKG